MIYNNLVIGSGFSSLGAVLALIKKKQSFTVVYGKTDYRKDYKSTIKLPSRNFNKFKKNICQSIDNNNLHCNLKNNFISYIGFGGLSNLWGKILNTNIND